MMRMGGIAGYIGAPQGDHVLNNMIHAMPHRAAQAVHFHRAQPLCAASTVHAVAVDAETGVTIVFAGALLARERYRAVLAEAGYTGAMDTDTDILMALYRIWGADMLDELRGRFALVIADRARDSVFLTRDPAGLVPLYYTVAAADGIVFASEIKSILKHPAITAKPDMTGVDAYLALGYVPADKGLLQDIHTVPAGHAVTITAMGTTSRKCGDKPAAPPERKPDEFYQHKFASVFESTITRGVAGNTRGAGIFLTGGVGSAALAAATAKVKPDGGIFTYALTFDEDGADVRTARAVAKRVGAKHADVLFVPAEMERLPEIIWALDAPASDPDIVTVDVLSRRAALDTDTVFSGKGVNIFLGGRTSHKTIADAYRIPPFLYTALKPVVRYAPVSLLTRFGEEAGMTGDADKERLLRFIDAMRRFDVRDQHTALTGLTGTADRNRLYAADVRNTFEKYTSKTGKLPPSAGLMALLSAIEIRKHYPAHIAESFEKITAQAGLRGEMPYLDRLMAALSLTVPDALKYRAGRDKILLRNYVESVMQGAGKLPKTDVAFPVGRYLFAPPVKNILMTCLSGDAVKRRGLFNPQEVHRIMTQARAGDGISARRVFALLTLEIWMRIFIDNERGWNVG